MQRLIERLDRYQREHLAVGYPLAVYTRFKEHNGARLAANGSYYAFFSIFPLMVAFVSILGIVLKDDPELREDLVDGAMGSIPVLGTQIEDSSQPITGNIPIVVIGVAGALWAGSKMIDALTFAFNELWDVPPTERPMNLLARLKGLVVLGVFGLGLAGSTLLAGLPAMFDLGAAGPLVGLAASAATNVVVIGLSLKLLVARRLGIDEIWPAAVPAGIAIVALQQVGVWLVDLINGSSDTYGAFAGIIGLLAWFHVIFQVLLLCVEISVVRSSNLVPRTLSPKLGHRTDGDRRALLLDARRIQRDGRVGYAVALDGLTEAGPHRPPHLGARGRSRR